jgi:hypothetical protein
VPKVRCVALHPRVCGGGIGISTLQLLRVATLISGGVSFDYVIKKHCVGICVYIQRSYGKNIVSDNDFVCLWQITWMLDDNYSECQ